MKLGSRWRIGDGSKIMVWEESWVHSTTSHRLIAPSYASLGSLRVKDLILPGAKAWNSQLIHTIFLLDIAQTILKVPLFESSIIDALIWSPSQRGDYTVKSALSNVLGCESTFLKLS